MKKRTNKEKRETIDRACDLARALRLSVRALKKQIPRKVKYEDVGYKLASNVNVYACICPSCGLHIIEFDDDDAWESKSDDPKQMFHDCFVHHEYIGLNNFCNRCGQKLDWEG